MNSISKTFCVLPFTHLNIKQKGKISACWRYPGKIGDYSQQALQEVWNDTEIKKIRKALLNGERYHGCKSCWDMEDSGIVSTRQQHTAFPQRNQQDIESIIADDYTMPISELQHIEIRFDNICNLMCRHCSSDYSSKWHAAVQQDNSLKNKMLEYGTYRESDSVKNLNDRIIDEIGLYKSHIKTILISGGEPLYHDKHYKFLENIVESADQIELSYNTNLTTLEYKGKNILDLWKNFRRILLRISIDAEPNIYTYVRTGNHLPSIEKNIQHIHENLKNYKLNATCTTSVLNITRLPEIFEYFHSIDAYVHTSLVQYPSALNPRILPGQIKDAITQKWNQWLNDIDKYIKQKNSKIDIDVQKKAIYRFGGMVIKYMNSKDCSNDWQKFIDYATVLDKFHNTNILENYPEYEKYWK